MFGIINGCLQSDWIADRQVTCPGPIWSLKVFATATTIHRDGKPQYWCSKSRRSLREWTSFFLPCCCAAVNNQEPRNNLSELKSFCRLWINLHLLGSSFSVFPLTSTSTTSVNWEWILYYQSWSTEKPTCQKHNRIGSVWVYNNGKRKDWIWVQTTQILSFLTEMFSCN